MCFGRSPEPFTMGTAELRGCSDIDVGEAVETMAEEGIGDIHEFTDPLGLLEQEDV